MAQNHNTSINEVLELYAACMDKQVDKYLSQRVIGYYYFQPGNRSLYWDLVESTLLATKDPLTGLDNRRSLETQLEKLAANFKRKQTPFSFIMIDLDHFKKINDQFGHNIGDLVLKAVAGKSKLTLDQPT